MYLPEYEIQAARERSDRYMVEARILRLIRKPARVTQPIALLRRSESLVVRILAALRIQRAMRSWQS